MKTVLRSCYKHHLYQTGDLGVKTVARSKKINCLFFDEVKNI